jgi:hypothetical protein
LFNKFIKRLNKTNNLFKIFLKRLNKILWTHLPRSST